MGIVIIIMTHRSALLCGIKCSFSYALPRSAYVGRLHSILYFTWVDCKGTSHGVQTPHPTLENHKFFIGFFRKSREACASSREVHTNTKNAY